MFDSGSGGGAKGRRLKAALSESTSSTAAAAAGGGRESILGLMLSGPRPIVSILIAWTDAARRHLSTVLRRLLQEGFQVVGLKLHLSLTAVKTALDSNDSNVFTTASLMLAVAGGSGAVAPTLNFSLSENRLVGKIFSKNTEIWSWKSPFRGSFEAKLKF